MGASKVIGLAGGIGTGKSLVSRILRTRGHKVYDCDLEAKLLMDSDWAMHRAMRQRWGEDVYREGDGLDRSRIAGIVFADSGELAWLNGMVHAAVKKHLEEWIAAKGERETVFVESAILASSGLTSYCDEVWEVTAPVKVRLKRLEARSGLGEKEALARIRAQEKESELLTESSCRMRVIDNDGVRPLLPQIPEIE